MTDLSFVPKNRRAALREALNIPKAHRPKKDSGKPFVGIDGEGGYLSDPERQEYLLLRAGEQYVESKERSLTLGECLNFLCDLPRDVIYVSYAFDYDVTMMFRELPRYIIRKLLDRESRTFQKGDKWKALAVDIHITGGDFQIDYLAHKEFRVRRKIAEKRYEPWLIVNDVFTFFQCTFVQALKDWFPEDELADTIERIAEGKEQRNQFGQLQNYEIEYNRLECLGLAALMKRFRKACDDVDLKPYKWQGPGQLAEALFRQKGIPQNKVYSFEYPDIPGLANDAFYGGRFEACIYGPIGGPVYQYDINSAYPSVYKHLPCLVHGEWEYIDAMPDDSSLYYGAMSFRDEMPRHLGFFPLRTESGHIRFPASGEGVYCSPEIELARRHGVSIEWLGGYRYLPQCDCDYFSWVEGIYQKRKALGKSGAGRVLKLALNSVYGKLAQSIGQPKYSTPIWASFITSFTRAQLLELALQGGGDDVIAMATDGLFCREKRDCVIGSQLGEWEETIHDYMLSIQSGIYYLAGKGPKTRGIHSRELQLCEAEFINAFRQMAEDVQSGMRGGHYATVLVEPNNFTSLRLASHREKNRDPYAPLENAGRWKREIRKVSCSWEDKRARNPIRGTRDGRITTYRDPVCDNSPVSVPYSKSIGNPRFETEMQVADSPDWSDSQIGWEA